MIEGTLHITSNITTVANATAYGISLVNHKATHGIRVGHIDQTDESDLNFLTRLGQRYDAIAAVKSERMLFTLADEVLTASGLSLSGITLTRRDGNQPDRP